MLRNKTFIFSVTTIVVVAAMVIFSANKLEVSLDEVLRALKQFSFGVIGSALGFLLLHSFFLLLRFFFLIPRANSLPFSQVTHAIGFGQIANNYLPGRAGDALKILILSRNQVGPVLPLSIGTGVMLADKVVDFAALLSVAILTKAYEVPGIKLFPSLSGGTSLLIGLALVIVGFLAVRQIRQKPESRVAVFLQNMFVGLGGTVRIRQVVPSYLCGLGVWLAEAAALQLLCSSQGFVIPIGQAMLALIILNVLVAIPLTFANIGPYEASLSLGLTTLGVGTVPAIAIAAAHHSLQLLNVLIFGAVGLCMKKFLLH